jgi:chemotaxis methyl-accepting protein methylase
MSSSDAPRAGPAGFEEFLAEVLPPLGLSPVAHRRRNIRRRIIRRMEAHGIHEYHRYLEHIQHNPQEMQALRALLVVTISRFFRNPRMWDVLSREVLGPLAAGSEPVALWSAGCASGEEPYTAAIAWAELPGEKPPLRIVATDVDGASLTRAATAVYSESSLREIPRKLREKSFLREGAGFRLREDIRESVAFLRRDLLADPPPPPGLFDVILCRNAVFTYFGLPERRRLVLTFASVLSPGGHLGIGRTESLPPGSERIFDAPFPPVKIYRLRNAPDLDAIRKPWPPRSS